MKLRPPLSLQARRPFDVLAPDVWAFGVTLFILLTGLPPWEVDTGPSAADPRYVYVRDGMLRTLLQTWGLPLTEGAMDLLQRCLTADPARRITFAEVQRHPWWLEQQALAAGAGSST